MGFQVLHALLNLSTRVAKSSIYFVSSIASEILESFKIMLNTGIY